MSSLKVKYNSASSKLHTTLGVWVDDVKLKLQFTEKSLQDVGTVKDDIEIGVEKPGHFILEHHLHKKHTRFQFHGHANVKSAPVKLTFTHHILPNPVTTLEVSSELNSRSKVTLKHKFGEQAPLVKYEYNQSGFAVEPHFDFGADSKHAWGLSLKHGHAKKDFLKATYRHQKQEAELEVHKKLDDGGPFKITATIDLNHVKKVPKLVIEKEWKI